MSYDYNKKDVIEVFDKIFEKVTGLDTPEFLHSEKYAYTLEIDIGNYTYNICKYIINSENIFFTDMDLLNSITNIIKEKKFIKCVEQAYFTVLFLFLKKTFGVIIIKDTKQEGGARYAITFEQTVKDFESKKKRNLFSLFIACNHFLRILKKIIESGVFFYSFELYEIMFDSFRKHYPIDILYECFLNPLVIPANESNNVNQVLYSNYDLINEKVNFSHDREISSENIMIMENYMYGIKKKENSEYFSFRAMFGVQEAAILKEFFNSFTLPENKENFKIFESCDMIDSFFKNDENLCTYFGANYPLAPSFYPDLTTEQTINLASYIVAQTENFVLYVGSVFAGLDLVAFKTILAHKAFLADDQGKIHEEQVVELTNRYSKDV